MNVLTQRVWGGASCCSIGFCDNVCAHYVHKHMKRIQDVRVLM